MTRLIPILLIVVLGSAWGFTQVMSKVAVSTGYKHFGLIFWQSALGVIVLGAILVALRRRVPMRRGIWKYYILFALIGTVIPNSFSYYAIIDVPSGIMSMLLSLVPILAFPIAIILGIDKFSLRRLLGLSLGLCAVLLIVGVPDALPSGRALALIPIAMIAPLCYAFEGNFVSKWGTGGADPVQLLFGASFVGATVSLVPTLYFDQWISPFTVWGPAEWAIVASAVIHALVYTMYVTVVRMYGAVFAVQTGYVVTISGVGWAVVLLGEWYTGPIWLSLIVLMTGVYLVTPKPS